MQQKYGILVAAVFVGWGCEVGTVTGGPGVEPPFVGPGPVAPQPTAGAGVGPPTNGAMDGRSAEGDSASAPDGGAADGGEPEPESCEQSAERFSGDMAAIAWGFSDCGSAEDCTLIRAEMECADRAFYLSTCAHAVNAATLSDIEEALTELAAAHYCTPATQDCTAMPDCTWPKEEARCVNSECIPVYP